MAEWNRAQLWSPSERSPTLLAVAILASSVAVATTIHACHDFYLLAEHRQTNGVIAECREDADCALLPQQMTCCGECEPAPPFEAVTTASVESRRQDVDDECAPRTRLCDPPVCQAVTAECRARAVCRSGQCRVDASPRCLYR